MSAPTTTRRRKTFPTTPGPLERCLACEADGRSPETLPFPGGPVQRRHKTLGLRKKSFSAKVRQPPQDPESKPALESDSLIATL
jgi:hypothetical protein